MTTKLSTFVSIFLSAVLAAEDKPGAQAAIGALTLPADADGLVHLRTGEGATVPLQLSLRNFSTPLKLPTGRFQLFGSPVANKTTPPAPLLTVALPEGVNTAFVMVWATNDLQGKSVWQSKVIDAATWPADTLKLINASVAPLGIAAADKRLRLTTVGAIDFPADKWKDPFPVEIFRLAPVTKSVFSSTWRVSAGQRELCVILGEGDGILIRSLIAQGQSLTDAQLQP
jgi:hypothetical protein